jgi:hypothetical protein
MERCKLLTGGFSAEGRPGGRRLGEYLTSDKVFYPYILLMHSDVLDTK